MKKISKFIFHLYKKLDISPISPGGLSKEFIVLFWGLNAVFFLASGLTAKHYIDPKDDASVCCTITKKISSTDLYTEETHIVNTSAYVIISSTDFELPESEFIIVPAERGPPQKFKV